MQPRSAVQAPPATITRVRDTIDAIAGATPARPFAEVGDLSIWHEAAWDPSQTSRFPDRPDWEIGSGLIDILVNVVDIASWVDSGGDRAAAKFVGGRLVIQGLPRIRCRVAEVIQAIHDHPAAGRILDPYVPYEPGQPPESVGVWGMEAALTAVTGLDARRERPAPHPDATAHGRASPSVDAWPDLGRRAEEIARDAARGALVAALATRIEPRSWQGGGAQIRAWWFADALVVWTTRADLMPDVERCIAAEAWRRR